MARRVSSSATFIYKRVFPIFWFGFLAFFIMTTLLVQSRVDADKRAFLLIPMFIVPLIMAVVGYFVFKAFLFDLADTVDDDGDSLIVTRGGESIRVALKDIVNVNHMPFRPERITLHLRQPTALGQRISFCPPGRAWPFSPHPLAEELIRRVDAARQR